MVLIARASIVCVAAKFGVGVVVLVFVGDGGTDVLVDGNGVLVG